MMGRREGGQGQFFYSFKLDEVVPVDHLVRQIDGVLDLGFPLRARCDRFLVLPEVDRPS